MKLNVLIACEESQAVCLAFRRLGHFAFSADLQECSGGHPEWHIVGDVAPLLNGRCIFHTQDGQGYTIPGRWNIVIAHPPCTYLTKAGATSMFPGKRLDEERYKLGLAARDFFLTCLNADAQFVCVENPQPMHIFNLPPPTTRVEPYEFGEPWTKLTYLWLRNLPPLLPTVICTKVKSYVYSTRGGKKRSKTFPGIATAMATQWTEYIAAVAAWVPPSRPPKYGLACLA